MYYLFRDLLDPNGNAANRPLIARLKSSLAGSSSNSSRGSSSDDSVSSSSSPKQQQQQQHVRFDIADEKEDEEPLQRVQVMMTSYSIFSSEH